MVSKLETDNIPSMERSLHDMAHKLATELTLRAILLKLNSIKANELLKEQLKEQSLAVTSHLSDQAVQLIQTAFNKQGKTLTIDECTNIMLQYSDMHAVTSELLDGIFSPPGDVAGIY